MLELAVEFAGRRLTPSEADQAAESFQVIVAGPDFDASQTIHAFASEAEFDLWAEANGVSTRVARLRDRIAAAQRNARDRDLMRHARAAEERMRAALEDLALKSGLTFDSEELLRAATLDRRPEEGRIFDSAILYADINYGGRWLPVYQDWPDLRWFGFNDVTSSIRGVGEGALFSDIHYRGRIYWLLGLNPIFGIPWLGGFNDLASSVAVYS